MLHRITMEIFKQTRRRRSQERRLEPSTIARHCAKFNVSKMPLIKKSVLQTLRIFLTTMYLFLVLITIPISFQVGGLNCGLSFTVTLFALYFVSTTFKLVLLDRGSALSTLIYYLQHLLIPSILFMFLSYFENIDSDTVDSEYFKVFWNVMVKPWQLSLIHSTPVFTLLEGVFTILAIQAIGETERWLKMSRRSNQWVILSLLISGGIITLSLFYFYRIYVTPMWELSTPSASLLGFTFSIVCGIGLYGINGSGSVMESSLFFAYMVRNVYEISPKMAMNAMDEIFDIVKETWKIHQANLPKKDNLLELMTKNYRAIWSQIVEHTPRNHKYIKMMDQCKWILNPLWNSVKNFTKSVPISIQEIFVVTFKMAKESLIPAVVINLVFRLLIFYSATRIIPTLQRNTKERRSFRRIMNFVYWYSPCIIIAMYTHLILRYSGQLKNDLCIWGCFPYETEPKIVVDSWSFWNWCNIYSTMLIYALELMGSNK
ncbi:Ice2p [Kluyveromyces lactis]|uniref:KLLA0E08207p n=1 Tax=Kluyveromyces lactis (strain ATCC 8585 / CBS 2359 / DSM 70799 / NBRC 1267 / NRRL Y-1140 / WM37) TaxID=284590 RepID=Q6CP19_KLULA|nr:uncharacterized protein KLLA0_E08207g [Kluyveromyces lactis]CAG99407.1 KLLA0E08207p [Kluyveromyces lactis]|eukprot:XP_454320.1 uncharacterized protein KLLA0_E08207g [Kluyveromyces lactis]